MKTLHKKFIGITAALLFAVSGSAAYAQTSAPAQAQLSLVNQIVAIIVANPEYRSFIPTVMSLLENIASDIDENTNELPTGNDVVYDPANIEDIDFDIDDDELLVTLSGSDGGCSRVQEPSVERNGDEFEITLLETNPANPAVVLCTADIRFFEKEVIIDLDDLDEDVYTVLVNGEEEYEFEITDENDSDENETEDIETTAKRVSVDGNDNDYADYTVRFSLEAFGDESYVSENAEDAVNFTILSGSNDVVYDSQGVQEGEAIISLTSSADIDDDFYRLDEGSAEEFEINVTYLPHNGVAAGNGSYRLQIESIEYAKTPGGSTFEYRTRPKNDFRTKAVQIVN